MESFTYASTIVGDWNDTCTDLTWTIGSAAILMEFVSTRGADEPAIAELRSRPGTMIMAIRGSNASGRAYDVGDPSFEGRRWISISRDYGRSWSAPEKLCFDDGTCPYSPASSSALIYGPNGRLYWIGNLSSSNTSANLPRSSLSIVEVDEDTLRMKKNTLLPFADYDPSYDSSARNLQLTNFDTYVDSKSILVRLYREDDAYPSSTWPVNWFRLGFTN